MSALVNSACNGSCAGRSGVRARDGLAPAYDCAVPQLLDVPKLINGLIEDVRTIARGMQVLPELARSLHAIEARVEVLDDEVRKMRQAVEAMGGDVKTMPGRLDELQHSLSPMRRIGRRLGRSDEGEEG